MPDPDTCSAQIVDEAAVCEARARLVSDFETDRTVAIFSALADRTRFKILHALVAEELCVCDISAVCGVSQSATSHQLRLLRDRGLVTYRREGPRAVYSLADSHVSTLISVALEHAAEGSGR